MDRGSRPTSPVIVWRWYSALLLANALDLLFTYVAVERGFEELNPVVRPVLLTPWLATGKFAVLAILAYGLWHIAQQAPHRSRAYFLLRGVTIFYIIVLTVHLVGLYGTALASFAPRPHIRPPAAASRS